MRRCQNGMGVVFLRSLLEKGRFGKNLLQDTARRWLLPQATKKGWFGLNTLLDVGYLLLDTKCIIILHFN